MKEQTYREISEAVRSVPLMKTFLIWFNRIVLGVTYVIYPALLVMLFLRKDEGFLPAILIPGISFVLLSMIRHLINAPRPYEVFGIAPVIDKKTAGHSFPSRHIFSIFVIATTVFCFYPLPGVLLGFVGAALAFNRVLSGVHFVKDVVAGAASGVFCGIVGFWIILPLLS